MSHTRVARGSSGEKQPAEQLDEQWETRSYPRTCQRYERLLSPTKLCLHVHHSSARIM